MYAKMPSKWIWNENHPGEHQHSCGCSGAPEVQYHRFWTPIYIYIHIYTYVYTYIYIYHISMEWFKGQITVQPHINGKVHGFL